VINYAKNVNKLFLFGLGVAI